MKQSWTNCWNSQLKQQAIYERLKPLIIYYDDITKILKPWRRLTPSVPFSPMEGYTGQGSRGSAGMWGGLPIEGPQNKRLGSFLWILELRRGHWGRARSRKHWALKVRKSGFKFPLFSPLHCCPKMEASSRAPKDLYPKPHKEA